MATCLVRINLMTRLVLVSKLVDLPIVEFQSGRKIGRVGDVLIELDTGKFIGVTIRGWFLNRVIVESNQIVSVDQVGLTIHSGASLPGLDEVDQAQKVFRRGFRLIGARVRAKSGLHLGSVVDASVDLESNYLAQIHVGRFLASERIISRDRIVDVQDSTIIVDDDIDGQTAAAPELA